MAEWVVLPWCATPVDTIHTAAAEEGERRAGAEGADAESGDDDGVIIVRMLLLVSADRAGRIVLFVREFEIILLEKKLVVEWLTRRLMERESWGSIRGPSICASCVSCRLALPPTRTKYKPLYLHMMPVWRRISKLLTIF